VTNEPRRYQQSFSTPWRRVGAELILAPLGRVDFQVISGSGTDVWELLSIPSTIAELMEELQGLYGVAPAAIARDIEALLTDLVKCGAIDQIDDAAETHADVP
jgi:hypothetical protein